MPPVDAVTAAPIVAMPAGSTVPLTPLTVLTLGLDDEVFAIDAGCVREILEMVPVTEVPGSLPLVNGLINVRGRVVPLADIRLSFGMTQRDATLDTRIVVVEIPLNGEPTTIGLLADKVFEVTDLRPADLAETPKLGMRWPAELIRCIGKRGSDFIIVCEIAELFSTARGSARAGNTAAH